jgi:hypothetical protein
MNRRRAPTEKEWLVFTAFRGRTYTGLYVTKSSAGARAASQKKYPFMTIVRVEPLANRQMSFGS